MVLTIPIFLSPWLVDETTAGMPAALVLGFLSLSARVSVGVRALAGLRIPLTPFLAAAVHFSMLAMKSPLNWPNNDGFVSFDKRDQCHVGGPCCFNG